MKHGLPFILACGMAVIAVALYAWDDQQTVDVVQAELPVVPEFNPRKREFTLNDGTPCVMVWTLQTNFPHAGESGVSCNWNYNVQGH